jgi:hypothetical protein
MAPLELTRREFVGAAGALAAASAFGGCTRGARRELGAALAHVQGGIVGSSDTRGHLVRDGAWLGRPPQGHESTGIVILGGGVAGLSAAWALERAGYHDFVVLELEDVAGGTSRYGETPTTPHPWGAHYLPVPPPDARAARAFLEEIGVIEYYDAAGRPRCAEQHLCRAPQERVYYKGRWYEGLYLHAGASTEDRRQLQRFHDEVARWVRARGQGGRRVFTLPRQAADPRGDGASELDGQSMSAWMDARGLTSWRLRWWVDYACRDDFGLRATETSAWAALHYYCARLLHPDDDPAEVLTWPEGNGYLVKQLLQRVGDRVRTGCVALDVRRLPGAAAEQVEAVYLDTRGGEPVPRAISARQLIFALPTFLRHRLIADLRGAPPPPHLGRFSYAPWLVANLTLRRSPPAPAPVRRSRTQGDDGLGAPGFPQCWDNVLVESPSLGYVVATHQREPALPQDGEPRTVWTYYLPLCGPDPRAERTRLFQTPWPVWRDAVASDLIRAEPELPSQLVRADVFRWGHGMIRPVPGLLCGDALEQAARSAPPLHFAHSDLSGMALFEEAQQNGVRAAAAALRELGLAPPPFSDPAPT